MDFEFNILDYIQLNMKSEIMDCIMVIWSYLGHLSFIWILITFILLICKKTRRIGIACVIGFVLCLIIANGIIKPIVGRIRPYDINTTITLLTAKEIDYSFPSGHTVYAMCYAAIFFRKNKIVGTVTFVFAAIMGFSRLYLYMHFPTDVIFGAILGIVIGIYSVYLESKIYKSGISGFRKLTV